MSIFIRNIACILIVAGLLFVVGCSGTQSGSKTLMNLFSFPKAEKEPSKPTSKPTSMGEFIGRDRVTTW